MSINKGLPLTSSVEKGRGVTGISMSDCLKTNFFFLRKNEMVSASKVFVVGSKVRVVTYFLLKACNNNGVPRKKNDNTPPMTA